MSVHAPVLPVRSIINVRGARMQATREDTNFTPAVVLIGTGMGARNNRPDCTACCSVHI
eukprot:SAG31_NODE_1413_length_8459_cov_7.720215_3_plen_59_part_00